MALNPFEINSQCYITHSGFFVYFDISIFLCDTLFLGVKAGTQVGVGIAALFGLECFACYNAGEVIYRLRFSVTGYYV